MKLLKRIFFTGIIFIGYNAFCQNEVIVIKLNSTTNELNILRNSYNELKPNELFRIKIEGINTYLYKVEINNEDINTTADLPKSILSLVDLGGLKDVMTNLNSISEIVKSLPEKESKDSGEELVTTKGVDELEVQINQHKGKVQNNFEALVKYQTDVNNLYMTAQDEQNKLLLVNGTATNIDYTTILSNFKIIKNDLDALNFEIVKNKALLEGIISANSKTLKEEANAGLNTLATQLITIYTKLEAVVLAINSELSATKYTALSTSLMELENNKKFEFVSLPIQRYEDVNKLEIKLIPRDEKAKLNTYKMILRIPDYEKSFWGVSTGFYITQNQERNFSLVERQLDDDSTVYDFIAENQSKQEVGVNTMVRHGINIGGESYRNLFWQFGFGAGLTINEKVKPRLLLGTGIAIGKKNKIMFDVGGIYMFYDKLSNAYQLEGNETMPSNFLVGATQFRIYYSLGYTIKL
jgi:hypothetical protein